MLRPRSLIVAIVALMVVVFGSGLPVAAQSVYSAWRVFTIADGLASNEVYAIYQQPDGQLWLATDAGISQFDGQWHIYDTSTGLVNNRVRAIIQHGDGSFWFATLQGVSRAVINGNGTPVFQSFTSGNSGLLDNTVHAILEDRDGSLWFATDKGVSHRTTGSGETGVWTSYTTASGLVPGIVNALLQDRRGQLWAGSDSGVSRFDGTMWVDVVPPEGLPLSSIQAMLEDRSGRIWFATDGGGVFRFDPEANAWVQYSKEQGLSDLSVWSMWQDETGALWFGTNFGGVTRYDEQAAEGAQWTLFDTSTSDISSNSVRAIWEDPKDRSMWFATTSGLNHFDLQRWHAFIFAESEETSTVYALMEDRAGMLWAGTDKAGLLAYDGASWQPLADGPQNAASPIFVASLLRDNAGRMWVGTNGNGLFIQGETAWQHVTQENGLAGNTVRAMAQARDASLWIGTFDGLSHYVPDSASAPGAGGTWQTIRQAQGLINDLVQAVLSDSQDRLWVGTSLGVGMLDSSGWHTYTRANSGLPAEDVRAIAEAADGSLWFGTWAAGVAVFDPAAGSWKVFRAADGLVSNGVLALLHDTHDTMWIGTDGGLSRYDGDTWVNYQIPQGLSGNFVASIYEDTHGDFWIGTVDGLTRYRADVRPPWTHIRSVTGRAPVDAPIDLRAEDPVSIDFAGGDLTTPGARLLYQYRLLPQDAAWQDTRTENVRFAPLAPGEYTFEVRTRDDDMNYSLPAQVRIVVEQPEIAVNLPLVRFSVPRNAFYGVLALVVIAVVASGMGVSSFMQQRRRPREALKRGFNPYVSGEPVRRDDMFFGRTELLKRILSILHNNSVMVHGERRIGKTSLLFQLADRLREAEDPDYLFVPIHIDLEGTPEAEFFHRLMEAIVESLPADALADLDLTYTPLQSDYSARDLRRDLRLIIGRLQEQSTRTVRMILLMDEVDAMNAYDQLTQQQLRRIFMEQFAHNLGAVVAGVRISKEWDRIESPWFNLFNEIELTPFAREDALALLREPVRGIYSWDDDALDAVINYAGGRPFRLQQYALEAVNRMLEAGRTTITLDDVAAAHEAILHMAES